MEVAFADLGRAVAADRAALDAAAARVLDSGRFVLGDEVSAFEAEFGAFAGGKAVGVASGTDAIELALRALGIGRGDEVVTQANTCAPTVAAIARAGGTPVLCDADPDTGAIDPESLERVLGAGTRAIVPVHLYGRIAPVEEVLAIAASAGATVVEDCAQAAGARAGGRHAGTFGSAGAFSFYPTKNLAALGDGGVVVSSDPVVAERVRSLRNYGAGADGASRAEGANSRLDELQAAILRARLAGLDVRNERRRAIAAHYLDALAGSAVRPLAAGAGGHAHHLFVVRVAERDRFREALAQRGIGTLVHYPRAIHQHPAYASLAGAVTLDGAELLASEVVSLPLYPELSDAEVEHVAATAAESAR